MPQNETQAEILRAAVNLPDKEAVKAFLRIPDLDFGCRPKPLPVDGGGFQLHVFAPKERLDRLRENGYSFEIVANASALGRERQAEVGVGDRFDAGRVTPRGLGEKIRC